MRRRGDRGEETDNLLKASGKPVDFCENEFVGGERHGDALLGNIQAEDDPENERTGCTERGRLGRERRTLPTNTVAMASKCG